MFLLHPSLLPKCYAIFDPGQDLAPHYRCELFSLISLISMDCCDVCSISEDGGEDLVIVLRVSADLIKCQGSKQLGEERINFGLHSTAQSVITGHPGRSSRQEPKGRN